MGQYAALNHLSCVHRLVRVEEAPTSETPRTSVPVRRRALQLTLLALGVAGAIATGTLLFPPANPLPPLVMVASDGRLTIANADGTGVHAFQGAPPTDGVAGLIRAPDGLHLALIGMFADFAIVDAAGNVTVADPDRRQARQIAWSPDGKRFAMLSGSPAGKDFARVRLLVAAPDGSDQWVAPFSDDAVFWPDFRSVAWSPDGRTIVVTGSRAGDDEKSGRTWVIDATGKSMYELPFVPETSAAEPTFGPDGALYLARRESLEGGLWRINPSTGAGSRLYRTGLALCTTCSTAYVRGLTVSPDNTKIAFVTTFDHVVVVDLRDGTVLQPREPKSFSYHPLAWSADSRRLVFMNSDRSGENQPSLVSVDIASGDAKVLADTVLAFDLAS